MDCLDIPGSVKGKIREHSKDEEQQREECIYYWMNVSPDSMIGWGVLGGRLHLWEEEAALRAANEYIQRAPGTCGCGMCMYHAYITQQIHACSDVHCVCSSAFVDYTDAHTDHICAHVHLHTHTHTLTRHTEPTLTVDNLTAVLDSVQENMDSVLAWIHIPDSKRGQLQQQYDSGQVNTARADYIIDHHPSPSWTVISNALWYLREAGALEMVQKLYLKGEPCAHSCRSEGRIILSIFELCNKCHQTLKLINFVCVQKKY